MTTFILNQNHQRGRTVIIKIHRNGNQSGINTDNTVEDQLRVRSQKIAPFSIGSSKEVLPVGVGMFHPHLHPTGLPVSRNRVCMADIITNCRDGEGGITHLIWSIKGCIAVITISRKRAGKISIRSLSIHKTEFQFSRLRAVGALLIIKIGGAGLYKRKLSGICRLYGQILQSEVVDTVCLNGDEAGGKRGSFRLFGGTVYRCGSRLGGLLPVLVKEAAFQRNVAGELQRLVDFIDTCIHTYDGIRT